jgi:HEAT repeat protein
MNLCLVAMIAFCTHCWNEIDASLNRCPFCGASVEMDARSYREKLVGALTHPLASTRARICWLLGENEVRAAVPAIMQLAESDLDMYVQKAALEALGSLKDQRAVPLLQRIQRGANRFLVATAQKSLECYVTR